jgi:hypothetical protein
MSARQRSISDDKHETELAQFFEMILKGAHVELAVSAALHHCVKYGRNAPMWLVAAASNLTIRLLNDSENKPAKNATPSARYISSMRKWIHWDLMSEVMKARPRIKKSIKILTKLSRSASGTRKHKEMLAERQAKLREAGQTSSDAPGWVSVQVEGSFASANTETIRHNYFEVKNAVGELGLWYYGFDKCFLKLVGIQLDLEKKGK